jgi:hypothetical protein
MTEAFPTSRGSVFRVTKAGHAQLLQRRNPVFQSESIFFLKKNMSRFNLFFLWRRMVITVEQFAHVCDANGSFFSEIHWKCVRNEYDLQSAYESGCQLFDVCCSLDSGSSCAVLCRTLSGNRIPACLNVNEFLTRDIRDRILLRHSSCPKHSSVAAKGLLWSGITGLRFPHVIHDRQYDVFICVCKSLFQLILRCRPS